MVSINAQEGELLFYENKYSLTDKSIIPQPTKISSLPLKVVIVVFFNPFKLFFRYKHNMERRYLVSNKIYQTKKSLTDYSIKLSLIKKAATYSPALHCSTIGASGLNFSVRNGKRWNTTAITA